jgi:hypothetical protein
MLFDLYDPSIISISSIFFYIYYTHEYEQFKILSTKAKTVDLRFHYYHEIEEYDFNDSSVTEYLKIILIHSRDIFQIFKFFKNIKNLDYDN